MVYAYIQTSCPLIFCQEHLGYLSCKINCKPWKLSSISILFCELNQVKWNHIYFSQKKDYFKALPFLCAWMMMICYPRNGWKENIQSLNHTTAPHFHMYYFIVQNRYYYSWLLEIFWKRGKIYTILAIRVEYIYYMQEWKMKGDWIQIDLRLNKEIVSTHLYTQDW